MPDALIKTSKLIENIKDLIIAGSEKIGAIEKIVMGEC